MYSPTQEQSVIIDCKDPVVIVEAYAGTGKTNTLVRLAEARKNEKILYLVFGKANEKDAQKKFKHLENVVVMTIHKLAYRELGKTLLVGRELNNLRPYDLTDFFPNMENDIGFVIAQAVLSLIKEYTSSSLTIQQFAIAKLKDKEEFKKKNLVELPYALQAMLRITDQMLKNPKMPIEHDYYLKLWQLSKPTLEYDVILVDEAQDISDAMIDVVIRQTHAQRIFIGDNYQQIFSWRGAVNALSKLSSISTKLSLTQTFRCPQNIAHEANLYLKLLGADKPLVSAIKGGAVVSHEPPQLGDKIAFISRTNAGVLKFLAQDKSGAKICFIGGLKSYNFQELADLKSLQFNRTDSVYSSFLKNFKTLDELEEYANYAGENALLTKIRVIRMIPNIKQLLVDIKARIVTDPNEADIVFMTAHRSKGLEFENVVIASDFFSIQEILENPKTAKRKLQNFSWEELNLLYVAITRAKRRLYITPELLLDQGKIGKIRDFIVETMIESIES